MLPPSRVLLNIYLITCDRNKASITGVGQTVLHVEGGKIIATSGFFPCETPKLCLRAALVNDVDKI